MIRLGIIGNSGRGGESLSLEIFCKVKEEVVNFIRKTLKKRGEEIVLVSGGSAWMDHVAVDLYLEWEFGGIQLYLPAEFNNQKYESSAEGRRLNELHASFSERMGLDPSWSLSQIGKLEKQQIKVQKGFFERNTLISKNCDILLAFTFGKEEPNPGGTLDTWKKFEGEKYHFCLKKYK